MTIDLSTFEHRRKYKGRYRHDLKTLQIRLKHIQVAYIVHGCQRGPDVRGMGRGREGRHHPAPDRTVGPAQLRSLADRRAQRRGEETRLPLALPPPIAARRQHLGLRSKLVRPRPRRTRRGLRDPAEWERSYGEINAFEAKLVEGGTTLVKLFIHTSAHEQDKRLRARLTNPWKRWKTGLDDYRNRDKRPQYLAAMHEMFARTDTGIAPWRVIDGNDKKAARIATLRYIVACLEAGVSMEPPTLDPAVEKVAEADLG